MRLNLFITVHSSSDVTLAASNAGSLALTLASLHEHCFFKVAAHKHPHKTRIAASSPAPADRARVGYVGRPYRSLGRTAHLLSLIHSERAPELYLSRRTTTKERGVLEEPVTRAGRECTRSAVETWGGCASIPFTACRLSRRCKVCCRAFSIE